jgi:hypothetical protein
MADDNIIGGGESKPSDPIDPTSASPKSFAALGRDGLNDACNGGATTICRVFLKDDQKRGKCLGSTFQVTHSTKGYENMSS